ncbi:glycosyltransferase [Spiribacter roseus]|uniref:glycosyltransferase n=1 Tax=Spiribacter roseus TaxID=1855875 RepID=UPI00132F760E|nr:glycosyltransferase [Spiribacter roseus]KAF0284083.1 glycosyl transferase family 2 [Spiribacter roseus]
MPELSVIIPAWNEAAYLPDTLQTLQDSLCACRLEADIIVVDNASTDATATIAAGAGARVVHEPEHRIARVRNAGAEAAASDWLLFLDADTRVTPAALQAMRAAMDEGCVGGGAPIGFDRLESAPQRLGLAAWNGLSRRLRLAAGCFVFARAAAHAAIGGFSEQLYAGDEIGYSRRLDRLGRPRGRRFMILDCPPVISSARKMDWFRPWQHALVLATFVLFPWAGRFKRLSWFWYRRP